jgi:hypothetical protein
LLGGTVEIMDTTKLYQNDIFVLDETYLKGCFDVT